MILIFVVKELDKTILFEVFTKKELDAKMLLDYYKQCNEVLKQQK